MQRDLILIKIYIIKTQLHVREQMEMRELIPKIPCISFTKSTGVIADSLRVRMTMKIFVIAVHFLRDDVINGVKVVVRLDFGIRYMKR